MEDPKILFGRRVRSLRKERGLSQEAFALKCGMDRSYMGGVERGERNIALVNIFKVAASLDLSPAELMEF
ncbi:UNVERIFIED_CONTAM: hypothetical protein GTU68_009752 [Idotea baltica]|nr:hypothetical protein [Idotea baltica]